MRNFLISNKEMFTRLDRVGLKQSEREAYHIGLSIKDAGKKNFGITKIEDKDFIQNLVNKVK